MNKSLYWALVKGFLTAASMIIGAKMEYSLLSSNGSFQSFFLVLTALLFKPKEVLGGQIAYLILGWFFPVFTHDTYKGLQVFAGNSTGYLIMFPVAAYWVSNYNQKSLDWFTKFSSTVIGHFFILFGGFLWLHFYSKFPIDLALKRGVMDLLPGAFMKSILATVLVLIANYLFNKEK